MPARALPPRPCTRTFFVVPTPRHAQRWTKGEGSAAAVRRAQRCVRLCQQPGSMMFTQAEARLSATARTRGRQPRTSPTRLLGGAPFSCKCFIVMWHLARVVTREAQSHQAPLLRSLTEGFRLIAASPLLRRMCLHLLCSYLVSSLLYFTRSVVIASSVSVSGARMRWFAAMHAYSAAIVLTLQLFATGASSPPARCIARTIVLALTGTATHGSCCAQHMQLVSGVTVTVDCRTRAALRWRYHCARVRAARVHVFDRSAGGARDARHAAAGRDAAQGHRLQPRQACA